MAPPFHRLSFRAFVHATEDEEAVLSALRTVVGDDVEVEASRAEGYHGNPITVLAGEVSEARRLRAIFDRLDAAGLLDGLSAEAEDRLDEDNQLHFRLDKDAAHGGELVLGGRGDVIAVWGKVEAYPARRDTALAALREYLEGR